MTTKVTMILLMIKIVIVKTKTTTTVTLKMIINQNHSIEDQGHLIWVFSNFNNLIVCIGELTLKYCCSYYYY